LAQRREKEKMCSVEKKRPSLFHRFERITRGKGKEVLRLNLKGPNKAGMKPAEKNRKKGGDNRKLRPHGIMFGTRTPIEKSVLGHRGMRWVVQKIAKRRATFVRRGTKFFARRGIKKPSERGKFNPRETGASVKGRSDRGEEREGTRGPYGRKLVGRQKRSHAREDRNGRSEKRAKKSTELRAAGAPQARGKSLLFKEGHWVD